MVTAMARQSGLVNETVTTGSRILDVRLVDAWASGLSRTPRSRLVAFLPTAPPLVSGARRVQLYVTYAAPHRETRSVLMPSMVQVAERAHKVQPEEGEAWAPEFSEPFARPATHAQLAAAFARFTP